MCKLRKKDYFFAVDDDDDDFFPDFISILSFSSFGCFFLLNILSFKRLQIKIHDATRNLISCIHHSFKENFI